MKLVVLHREFINRSTRPLISSGLPIKVSNLDKPIIAIEKWKMTDGKLNKKFMLESYEDRNRFLKSVTEQRVKPVMISIGVSNGSSLASASRLHTTSSSFLASTTFSPR